jgi:CubicO group peptidase (beta-lactamase class C family)
MRSGRPGRRGRTAVALALLAGTAACGDSPSGPSERGDIDISLPWQYAEPAALGMDGPALERAASQAGALPRMRSLVVVREGRIALERYYNGFGPDSLADLRSVTKSVVSMLTGIAMDQGGISSLDLTLGELLTQDLGIPSAAQAPISLRHLLTMSGGFQWDESGVAEYNDWRRSGDFVQYLLDRPVVSEPGTAFTYNSAAVHLLSLLVERSMGASLILFANVGLFQPLGITRGQWEGMIDGTVNGGAGLDLRPLDLARLGQLYLQRGRSGGRTVVRGDWVDLTTEPAYDWSRRVGPAGGITYGHLWWVDRDRDAFFAWGYGGQFLYVVPARRLVVVTTTDWSLLSQEGGPAALEAAVMEVIVEGVVPAAPPISGSR